MLKLQSAGLYTDTHGKKRGTVSFIQGYIRHGRGQTKYISMQDKITKSRTAKRNALQSFCAQDLTYFQKHWYGICLKVIFYLYKIKKKMAHLSVIKSEWNSEHV
jgi:hypothetical protein